MKYQRQYDAREIQSLVKAEQTELHYDRGGHVSIHAAGCGHSRFATEVSPFAKESALADDWFYLAPCAKKDLVKA